MIMNYIKTGFEIIIFLFGIETLGKIFVKHTLVGRSILFIIKDIWLFFKLCFRICKYSFKTSLKRTQQFYNFMNKQCQKFNDKNLDKDTKKEDVKEKKVACDENNNVIDFKQIKNKHNK